MTYIELFLLAVGLCFDTFAVSLAGGMCMETRPSVSRMIRIVMCFAVFQAGFAALGWVLGRSVMEYIAALDHWIAFALLVYIGGKMIAEGISSARKHECHEQKYSLLKTSHLVLLSIATSIDAVAVGLSLAVVDISGVKIISEFGMVFASTAAAALAGLYGGGRLGRLNAPSKAEIAGGVILVCIGVKILVEHL